MPIAPVWNTRHFSLMWQKYMLYICGLCGLGCGSVKFSKVKV